MNKKFFYVAAMAIVMTACNQENLDNSAIHEEYALSAEIVQTTGDDSRVNIGDTEKTEGGKNFSRVKWESGDTFCAYNASTKFTDVIPFTFKESETDGFNAVFTTEKAFAEADVTYAVYPKKRFKGLKNNGMRVMLGLPDEQNMTESQDAVMIGKYDAQSKKMKFEQTMTMLEIVMPEELTGNVCVQIEADKPIAAGSSKAKIEVKDSDKGFSGSVEILSGETKKTITLFRNLNYAGKKVYCAVPTQKYQYITIKKGTYTEQTEGEKTVRTATIDEQPLVKITATDAAKGIDFKKRLYTINCTK